jgi:phosphoribosyl 1,2-cyclic phosphate phosphodiesterase
MIRLNRLIRLLTKLRLPLLKAPVTDLISTTKSLLKVTFLGTGTSQGVPVIACSCDTCISADPRDKRLRTSVLIEDGTTTVVIDSGPDFRQQMLRAGVKKLDGLVFTHEHKDHLAGLDDVRAFNFQVGKAIDLYASDAVQQAIRREFHYAFESVRYPGVPELNLITIDSRPFRVGTLEFTPIRVKHYLMDVFGFRIGPFTYITDAKSIAQDELQKVRGSRCIVLNALRREPHISHFTLEEAIGLMNDLCPENGYLTHLSHQMGLHSQVSSELPSNIQIAYDGLTIEI